MTTYTDEVNIYNPDAIGGAIDDAGNAYKTYITEVTSDGIMVAAAGKGTSNGSIVSTTTGWHLSDVLEWVRNGVSRFWIGLKNQGDTTPTVRIGKAYVSGATDNESHMELDYHSMQLIDREGDAYFHVSDLRNASGIAEITDVFVGDGTTRTFRLSTTALGNITSYVVKVNGSVVTSGFTISSGYITFTNAPANNSDISVSYGTDSQYMKAYTLGTRGTGNLGAFSTVEGFGNVASGLYSHAEGYSTTASGNYSHAEGYSTTASGFRSHAEGNFTVASGSEAHAEGSNSIAKGGDSHAEGSNTRANGAYSHAQGESTIAACRTQAVLGKYNREDASTSAAGYGTYAVIVGNGTSGDARRNAFTADWSGGIQLWHKDIERGTVPSSSTYGGGGTLQLVDKDGHQIGYLQPMQLSDGTEGIQLGVSNSDSTDWNTVQLAFDSNDDPTVSVSDADKWRNALGITDSSWQTLTLDSATNAYDSSSAPKYRKCFNVVNVIGAVKPKSQVAAGGTLTIGTLPSGYRPVMDTAILCQGSGQNKWMLRITSAGVMTAERYSSGGTTAAMSTSAWLIFNATFICA